jgi:hypothetical protein
VAASQLSDATVVTGRGIAIAPYEDSLAAAVTEIEVNKKTGKVVATHLYISQDAGLGINPGLLENQMIGGAIMATSRVLHEQVRFNTRHVTKPRLGELSDLALQGSPERDRDRRPAHRPTLKRCRRDPNLSDGWGDC